MFQPSLHSFIGSAYGADKRQNFLKGAKSATLFTRLREMKYTRGFRQWAQYGEIASRENNRMVIRNGIFILFLTLLPVMAQAQHQHGQEQPAVKSAPVKSSAAPLQPAEGASIKILAPTKGEVVKGDKVPVEFKLTKGKRGHHAHAYVDGELMGMFESAKGTLNGIKPGKHILELRVVASDHQTELAARDTVEFTVK